jgi:hypothetical protein
VYKAEDIMPIWVELEQDIYDDQFLEALGVYDCEEVQPVDVVQRVRVPAVRAKKY